MNIKKLKNYLLSISVVSTPLFMVSCSNTDNNNNTLHNLILQTSNNSFITLNLNKNDSKNINDYQIIDNVTNQKVDFNLNKSYIKDNKMVLYVDTKINNPIKIVSLTNKNFQIIVFNYKNLNSVSRSESLKYFDDFIKDVSTNNIPIIFDSRNASLIWQQIFYIALVNYFNNENKESNDFAIVLSGFQDEIENRYNSQALIDNGIWNGEYDIDKINKIEQFNLLKEWKYSNNVDYKTFKAFMDKIIDKFNLSNKKFDFVIPDANFFEYFQSFVKSNDSNSVLGFIIRHCNRLLIISDGNYHTNNVIPLLEEKLINFKPQDKIETIKWLKKYQNNQTDVFTVDHLLNLLLLKNFESINENSKFNFIHFINFDNNTINTNYLDDSCLWNETSFSTNFFRYSNLISNTNKQHLFTDVFQQIFFKNQNRNSIDNFFVNGASEYDPNKRNAIFIGSSLFAPFDISNKNENNYSRLQLNNFKNTKKAVQEQMQKFLNQFPSEEYNIIFKLHPVYFSTDDTKFKIAINYVKLITNNLIENPIIIDSSIPFEALITNDYYNYMQNNNNNFIFKENSKYKAYEWTTFFGLQATTSAIQTTRLFYQDTFNLTNKEIAILIPFSNFPIPTKFHIVNRIDGDTNHNFYNDNLNKIYDIYKYYCPSLFFNIKELEEYDSLLLNF